MPSQDAAATIASGAESTGSDTQVDRRLLIDGRLVATDRTFPGVGREMGVAGLEEFLERKTFATVVG